MQSPSVSIFYVKPTRNLIFHQYIHMIFFPWLAGLLNNPSTCLFCSKCFYSSYWIGTSQVTQKVKNLPAMEETQVWFLGWRFPGEGNGYPLQYSCLENPMDRGAWWVTVHGVTKSWTTEWLTFIGLPFLIIWKFLFQFASQFQNNFYWFHGSFLVLLFHKSINFFYWNIII